MKLSEASRDGDVLLRIPSNDVPICTISGATSVSARKCGDVGKVQKHTWRKCIDAHLFYEDEVSLHSRNTERRRSNTCRTAMSHE